jgi:hypothetical protein
MSANEGGEERSIWAIRSYDRSDLSLTFKPAASVVFEQRLPRQRHPRSIERQRQDRNENSLSGAEIRSRKSRKLKNQGQYTSTLMHLFPSSRNAVVT